ncbi:MULTISPECIES: META domain-containing protein [Photobacterium]|uniref:Heat shock protein HslJ n=1 Tax=Photobacterium halotolerans TaxID=265726 RepID=A0A0F5VFX7_9GAMM|nr:MULTISPECIES: META domain-containing protein [Photobacterium]KKD00712.1 heat shock protein HslJ [Photobacterium halotolerans]UIP26811.1 META domain-containing protein [Photobacterium sp. TLY01]
MKKHLLTAMGTALLLSACAGTGGNTTADTSADLTQYEWELSKIDNQAVTIPSRGAVPTLGFENNTMAHGHSGCNRYFGSAELKDGQFRIEKMGMTMMACPDDAMKLERVMSDTLSQWSKAEVKGNTLTLSNNQHTLTFTATQPM